MKEEIGAAVDFLTCLVGKSTDITAEQVKVFQSSLGTILTEKFKGHWFPEQPVKGQAYRCIRVNSSVPCDAALEKAASMCGVRYENLKLPLELTIWVDPQEVCCRFGESCGSLFTIASFKDKENLSNNIKAEDILLQTSPPETPLENGNKSKPLLRKSHEKPKKTMPAKKVSNPHPTIKGFMPKVPFMNSKHFSSHPSAYLDWNPAMYPFARIPHPHGYQDLSYLRRPRRIIRSAYANDRYHWARK